VIAYINAGSSDRSNLSKDLDMNLEQYGLLAGFGFNLFYAFAQLFMVKFQVPQENTDVI